MYVVFTEIITDNGVERWYYGTYEESRADEVAFELGHNAPNIWHKSCPANEAKDWGVKNLPLSLM